MIMQEEWKKLNQNNIPKGDFIVTNFTQNTSQTEIVLEDGNYIINVLFDGIPVLSRSTVEGIRMRTWGEVQAKYNDQYIFRNSFFFEVKKSNLIQWCIEESCGFYESSQLRHYCIVTSEEIIDVISTFEPTIKVFPADAYPYSK